MSAASKNKEIWDEIYDGGSLLWYPAEALVRLVRRREREGGFPGIILDHGCGSGNVAEFLIRSGHKLHCTDISSAALRLLGQRFQGALLPRPATSLIDLGKRLRPQLPVYDHCIAWQSLCYSDIATARANLADLIEGLPSGGVLIVNFPTPEDQLYRHSEPMPDGSRRLIDDVSNQMGAIVTVPASADELRSWCPNIVVRDVVEYGLTFAGERSEYFVLYGVKA